METSVATAKSQTHYRRSAISVMVAGVHIIIAALGSAAVDELWVLILLGFLGMVYGVPGLHEYQAPADGAFGKWGSLLVRIGGSIMVLLGIVYLLWEAVGDPPEAGPAVIDVAWMVGFVAFVVGVIRFAIGIIKAKVLPAGSGVLMIVGLVAAVVIDMATGAFFADDEPGTTQWGFLIGVPVFGVGLAWAGYSALKQINSRSSTQRRAGPRARSM